MENRAPVLGKFMYRCKKEQSRLPEGDAYSTALNMAHLPTEVASINEMGEEIDSFDKLPGLTLPYGGSRSTTRLPKLNSGSGTII